MIPPFGMALIAAWAALAPAQTRAADIPFTHFVIDSDNPPHPHAKTLGDINGDGYPDALAASSTGDETGLFWYAYPDWNKTRITRGSFSTDMQAGDVDRDGDLDVIIPKGIHTGHTVFWYENPRPEGDPAKDPWKEHAVGRAGAHDVEIGDLNGDKKLDVVVRHGDTTVLLQNAPDDWTAIPLKTGGRGGLALGDIDNDGDLDLAQNGYWLEAPKDKVNGEWKRHPFTGGGPDDVGVTLADMNRDGHLDLLLAPAESPGRLAWFEAPNDPKTRAWREHVIDPSVSHIHTFKVGDMDLDGDSDVVTAEMHQTKTRRVTVYRNPGNARKWIPQVVARTGSHNLRLGDVDNDGDLDIFGANWNNSSPTTGDIELWRNGLKAQKRRSAAESRSLVSGADQTLSPVHGGDFSVDERSWRSLYTHAVDLDDRTKVNLAATGTSPFRFKHHFISTDLPVYNGVGDYGHSSLTDMDRDGDLDFVVGRKGKPSILYWFEFQAPDRWVKHVLGHNSPSDVGAAAHDVDGDGWPDLIASGVWYRNPGTPRAKEFTRHVFDPDGGNAHDVLLADMDGDGKPDVVRLREKKDGLAWYKIPKDPYARWEKQVIGDGIHGAILPAGVDDIDGDGDPDVVMANTWFENRDGKGSKWAAHRNIPFGRVGPYGMCVRTAIVDIDGDGKKEVVMGEADIVGSKIAILRNLDGKGGKWSKVELPQSFTYGSLHSLAVADFNGDGRPDILVNEQEELLPPGRENPRWVLWENRGSSQFKERILLDAKLGGHDLMVGDVDGDGDVDICSKIWGPRDWNAVGGKMHVDFLENLSSPQTGDVVKGLTDKRLPKASQVSINAAESYIPAPALY